MSILTAIRETFTAKHQQQRASQATRYRELVRMIADGKEPDPALLDELVTSDPGPVRVECPQSARHRRIESTKNRDTEGRTQFVCSDCGSQRYAHAPAPAVRTDARKTLDELQADVELLQTRRQWRAELDNRPQLERRQAQLTKQFDEANEKVKQAIRDRDALAETLEPEQRRVQHDLNAAEAARERLLATCMDAELVASEQALIKQRGAAALRHRELSDDLWGYGRPGSFDGVMQNSTGAQLHVIKQKIEVHQGIRKNDDGTKPDPAALAELKAQYERFSEFTFQPRVDEWQRLRDELPALNQQLAALAQQKLEP